MRYTQSISGEIYAAELYNEPNAPEPDWDAEGHSAEDYVRDFAKFRGFMSEASPATKVAGPGVIELGIPAPSLNHTSVEEYMTAEPRPEFDIVSYHYYGAVSERCVPADSPAAITADEALSEAWLAWPDKTFQKHTTLRDQYAPGAPIWLTETGAASCGGTRWQPTFLDTFRMNRQPLELNADDSLPTIAPQRVEDGAVTLEPTSVNFITLPEADNDNCAL